MKAFTSIEQSKKLAEILPLESADMSYRPCREEGGIPDYQSDLCPHKFASWIGIPCWSLAALLGILPNSIYDNTNEYNQLEFSKISVAYHDMNDGIKLGSIKDNLVDACYEMIIELHEKNLL